MFETPNLAALSAILAQSQQVSVLEACYSEGRIHEGTPDNA